jgi:hypothetical protein
MSTRLDKTKADGVSIPTGYEGQNVATDDYLPSCTLEDVDRALFNLFNKDIPLFHIFEGASQRAPVIFATGERFAILRRKQPLRDKAGALILPLVSIMRSEISQNPERGMGPGQGGPTIIKKKLSKDDPRYQRLLNKRGLKNQPGADHTKHKIGSDDGAGTEPGEIASRRADVSPNEDTRSGKWVKAQVDGANMFEIITMPPVKFFQVEYEVTFWTQYTQQMNDMLAAVMTSYHDHRARSYRIESDKGYWFVAYFDAAISPANNHEDFSDDERLVKYSFNISVPGYLIMPDYPGSSNALRKYVSAPETAFGSNSPAGIPVNPIPAGIQSSNVNAYILHDFAVKDSPLPGQGIGVSGPASTMRQAGVDELAASIAAADNRAASYKSPVGMKSPEKIQAELGGYVASDSVQQTLRITHDPFTGKKVTKIVRVKTRNQRKGETVYREGLSSDLGEI